jgi:hypothetical protein
MRIHEYEGFTPGKCGKSRIFDTCLPSRFSLLKQNCRAANGNNVSGDWVKIRMMSTNERIDSAFRYFENKSFLIK